LIIIGARDRHHHHHLKEYSRTFNAVASRAPAYAPITLLVNACSLTYFTPLVVASFTNPRCVNVGVDGVVASSRAFALAVASTTTFASLSRATRRGFGISRGAARSIELFAMSFVRFGARCDAGAGAV
jgi:hypothetical protein